MIEHDTFSSKGLSKHQLAAGQFHWQLAIGWHTMNILRNCQCSEAADYRALCVPDGQLFPSGLTEWLATADDSVPQSLP